MLNARLGGKESGRFFDALAQPLMPGIVLATLVPIGPITDARQAQRWLEDLQFVLLGKGMSLDGGQGRNDVAALKRGRHNHEVLHQKRAAQVPAHFAHGLVDDADAEVRSLLGLGSGARPRDDKVGLRRHRSGDASIRNADATTRL